ncbi:TPA: hypothetical protein WI689_000678 [Neisseria meningitidis]|uniref:Lipoprotein n=3 Tax=Neisseria meningitidis TaxID=487 RepID=X5EPJ4_NEIME|nr:MULTISPECIES: hypothetical protein [Neisseria]EGC52310.1 putative lipoprotein [Neisseria meningitidis OX99.30304]EGC54136.1 putative lipoprotein [Neisseria meningitidis M6190]EGC60083.1 putative lipoprotein [Neisseria meningitidis ES14902]ELL12889.1 putative membrane protein [Neisseria meningitidis 61103]EOB84037.1 putative membrane protein [Neisseria meningitidis NM604]EOC09716.1 putative membrane protein [Neisseria meningitidis 73696]EQD04232.1 putative membrane protein [Neisseria menin
MNTRIIVSAAFVALALAGCGSINNVTVSDQKLQERAAFALGVSPNAVKISNRSNEGIRINFTATVGKRVSQCYVTSVISTIGVTTSDAICLGGGTHKGKSQCNALLKAAGRC